MSIERLTPSFDFDADRLEALRQLFPEAFADGAIDWERLKDTLAPALAEESEEHFGLNWPGKRAARRLASAPPYGTLVPAPGQGVNEDTTRNLIIEADNLEALKCLQKSYAGQVKLIYIDPPYNTGNDFVYKDDFRETHASYLRRIAAVDEDGQPVTTAVNSKAGGRFHSNWLSMMYPRLLLARNLLTEDGAVFVSIDDNEVQNLRLLLAEVLGEENFVATLIWQRSKKGDAKLIAQTHEYVHVFAKNKPRLIETGAWRRPKEGVTEVLAQYAGLRAEYHSNHEAIRNEMVEWFGALKDSDPRKQHKHYKWSDDRGLYFADNFAGPDDGRVSRPRYEILHPVTGKPCKKPSTGWRWEQERTLKALAETPPRIHFGADETTIPCRKSYLFENTHEPMDSVFYRDGRAATVEVEQLIGPGLMDFPKNTDVMRQFIGLASSSQSIILDFFAGSGTTAQAVMEQNAADGGNRRFVLVQLPEPTPPASAARTAGYPTIAAITKERVRRAAARIAAEHPEAASALDLGFRVFTSAPSHFRLWPTHASATPETVALQLSLMADPLIEGWTPAGLLAEILLQQGFPLDSRAERLPAFPDNHVWRITSDFHEHVLILCLDRALHPATLVALPGAVRPDDLILCLDSALDDQAKVRLADGGRLQVI